jgi:hypothetical protein
MRRSAVWRNGSKKTDKTINYLPFQGARAAMPRIKIFRQIHLWRPGSGSQAHYPGSPMKPLTAHLDKQYQAGQHPMALKIRAMYEPDKTPVSAAACRTLLREAARSGITNQIKQSTQAGQQYHY